MKPHPSHKQSHLLVGPTVGFGWVMMVCSLKMDGLLYVPQVVLAKKVGLGLAVGVEGCNSSLPSFYRKSQVLKRSRRSLSTGSRLRVGSQYKIRYNLMLWVLVLLTGCPKKGDLSQHLHSLMKTSDICNCIYLLNFLSNHCFAYSATSLVMILLTVPLNILWIQVEEDEFLTNLFWHKHISYRRLSILSIFHLFSLVLSDIRLSGQI